MKKNDKEVKDALNALLKAIGTDETVDSIIEKAEVKLKEKLPCGHTREEHAAAMFLTKQAADAGMPPKILLAAAKALVEKEDDLLALQAERDMEEAMSEKVSTDSKTPVIMSPMPKETH